MEDETGSDIKCCVYFIDKLHNKWDDGMIKTTLTMDEVLNLITY